MEVIVAFVTGTALEEEVLEVLLVIVLVAALVVVVAPAVVATAVAPLLLMLLPLLPFSPDLFILMACSAFVGGGPVELLNSGTIVSCFNFSFRSLRVLLVARC